MLPPAYPRTKIVLSNGLPPAYGETAPFATLPLAYGDAGVEFLFSDNDAGFWSDLSRTELTFQDTSGATPSDAVSEPIGLVRGVVGALTLTQGTAASKLTRGRAPRGGIRNRLTYSDSLGTSPWALLRATLTADHSASPVGTFDKLIEAAVLGNHVLSQPRTGSNETCTVSVYGKAAERSRLLLSMSNFSTASGGANLDFSTGSVVSATADNADYTSASGAMSLIETGVYRGSATATKGSVNTENRFAIEMISTGTTTNYTGDGTSGILLSGAQFERSATMSAYQAVGAAYDVTESGVASVPTAYADGGDIWSYGVSSFGDASNGLYAAASNNWSATVAFAGFGTGSLLAQTEQALEANRMFDLLVNSSAQLQINIRGTVTTLKNTVDDGNFHLAQIICTNGVVTVSVDGASASTPTVGTAASEAVQITVAGRNNTTPTNRYTGHMLPPMLIDRALSAGERAAEFAYYDSLLKIP